MIPEYLEHRPVYAGMVVPYVAIWSDEKDPTVSRVAKWHGIEWIYTDRQSGVPDFGSTNSHRQRMGMLRGRCQICGRDGATLYVVPDDRDNDQTHVNLWDADRWILNPPLHQHCLEYSKHVCPHLQRITPYAVVESHRPLPVVGYTSGPYALPIDAGLPHMLGRELIVRAP